MIAEATVIHSYPKHVNEMRNVPYGPSRIIRFAPKSNTNLPKEKNFVRKSIIGF